MAKDESKRIQELLNRIEQYDIGARELEKQATDLAAEADITLQKATNRRETTKHLSRQVTELRQAAATSAIQMTDLPAPGSFETPAEAEATIATVREYLQLLEDAEPEREDPADDPAETGREALERILPLVGFGPGRSRLIEYINACYSDGGMGPETVARLSF